MGDDLEENFILDDEFADSSAAAPTVRADEEVTLDRGAGVVVKSKKDKKGKKRKAEDDDEVEAGPAFKKPKTAEQLQKKKEKFKEMQAFAKQNKAEKRVSSIGVEDANADEQAAFVWAHYVHTLGDVLTPLEIEEGLSGECFRTVPAPRSHLSALRSLVQDQRTLTTAAADTPVGAPLAIIISASAPRGAEIYREVEEFGKKVKVLRLLAKHYKVPQQVQWLKAPVRLAVGTAGRMQRLVEMGALNLTEVKHIIIDMARDVKSFSIFDQVDARKDLLEFVRQSLLPLLKSQQATITFV